MQPPDAPSPQTMPRPGDEPPQHPEVIYLDAVEEPPLSAEQLPSAEKKSSDEPSKEEKNLRRANPDEIIAEVKKVTRRADVEIVSAREESSTKPPVRQKQVVPVDVAATTRSEPNAESVRTVVKPSVDVVGIALSLAREQSTQSNRSENDFQKSQSVRQVAQLSVTPGAQTYWQMATEQTKISQSLIQQSQQQSNSSVAVEVTPPSQAQFEDDFNDALATGQSVGQFSISTATGP